MSRPTAVASWIVAGYHYHDDELPPPFNSVETKSDNIGAIVWIHFSSGAMVAAIPTGRWKDRALFAFYYAGPNAAIPIPLQAWTSAQTYWDGSNSGDFVAHHRAAVEYFNSAMNQTSTPHDSQHNR